MIYNVLLIIQIIVALSIIGLVLMQHGKGADAGAAFGGGASGTVFGSQGSTNFLSRTTGILAAVFFANSLALAWLVSHRGDTTFSSETSVVPQTEVAKEVKAAPKPVPSDVPTSVGNTESTTSTDPKTPVNSQDEKPADVPN